MNPDFRDMLCALNAEGVKYLVVGAHAMAAHNAPRATGDLDILVRPDAENAQRVLRALIRFRAPTTHLSADDFALPDAIVQFGVPPNRIDLITSIDGVEFETGWKNRMSVKVEDVPVECIGLTDLIANKRATGRSKDKADLKRLERMHTNDSRKSAKKSRPKK